MVSAWYMDDSDADPRLEHQLDPPQTVDLGEVYPLTGVLYWKVNDEQASHKQKLARYRIFLLVSS